VRLGGDESMPGMSPGCSEELTARIDEEVAAIVLRAQELARRLLVDGRARMDAVVARLIEVETLRAADLDALLAEVEASSSEQPAAG